MLVRQSIRYRRYLPPKANRRELRAVDLAIFRNRNLIERFFCRMKQFRRIAIR